MQAARDLLADLISVSATWQSWTGTASAAAAKARVHQVSVAVGVDGSFTRPLALLPSAAAATYGWAGYSNAEWELWFEGPVAADAVDKTAIDAFEAKVQAIVQEMVQESRNGGRIMVRAVRQVEPASRSRRQEDHYLQVCFVVQTGLAELP